MPDDSSLTSGSFGSFLSGLAKQQSQAQTNVEGAIKEFEAKETQLGEKEKSVEAMKPPALTPTEYVEPKKTSALEAFGSPAMWLATLGGLLTRNHLQTSLNSAAGVLNAYRQQDLEQADKHFQQWKIANENATKLYNFQNEAYRTALEGVQKDRATAVATLRAKAAAFDDKTALTALSHGIGEFMRLQEAREKQQQAFEKSQPQVELDKLRMDATVGLLKARQSGDQAGIAKYTQQLKDISMGQHTASEERAEAGGAGHLKLTAAETQTLDAAKDTLPLIDELIDVIRKNPNTVGVSGKLAETRGNIISQVGGTPSDTSMEASDIESRAAAIRGGLTRALQGSGRYTEAAAKAMTDKLLPGGMMRGSDQVIQDLGNAKEALEGVRKDLEKKGGGTTPDGSLKPIGRSPEGEIIYEDSKGNRWTNPNGGK